MSGDQRSGAPIKTPSGLNSQLHEIPPVQQSAVVRFAPQACEQGEPVEAAVHENRPDLNAGRIRIRALPQPYTFRSAKRLRAWMLVLPVDATMLLLPSAWTPEHAKKLLAMTAISLLLFTGGRRYHARLYLSVLDELPGLFGKTLISLAAVSIILATQRGASAIPDFLIVATSSVGLLIAGRVVTTQIILYARRHGLISHRTLLVGSGTLSTELAHLLAANPKYGLVVTGLASETSPRESQAEFPTLGALNDIESIVRNHKIEVIIIVDPDTSQDQLLKSISQASPWASDLLTVPMLHQLRTVPGSIDHIESIPILRITSPDFRGFGWLFKRGIDVIASSVMLILLAPILAICAIAVRLEGGPGVLFRQERVGRNGIAFECLKFRSMRPSNAQESATTWSIVNDPRVGPVGRILRRTSLDELPQLWNILRGDMTLVGPRPERAFFVQKYSTEIPRYQERLRAPSGLTGFAQISGLRGDTSIADRARFDNYYIANWSLWMDVKIILRTLGEVLFARGR
jgi:exopolysaccharide biosynthesis polyprenyl glycosylphosphotransferase